MTKQPRLPDPETSKRLLTNLRKTRLEMQQFNMELDAIIASLEQESRERQYTRVRRSLAMLDANVQQD